MSCQQDVGILDENGKLTKEAKDSFISQILLVLEYGTEKIPADKKPPIPFSDKLEPSPNFKEIIKKDPNYLKDEKTYSSFHRNWVGRYEKLAKDLNLKPNFSLLPAIADPIAIAGSGFNADIPPPDFPGGFAPYFTGLLPLTLIGPLVDSGETKFLSPTGPAELVKTLVEKKAPPAPTPPAPPVIVPPPLPPGFSLSAPDPNKKIDFNLTPEQLAANAPKPPEAVFSSLAAKEFAAVENLPKALGELISKIPSLLPKLGNPNEVVGDIGKIVKSSGMLGPEPKETSHLEKAAQAVLASKIAEMKLVAGLAVTIGSAPGSATSSITQITSDSREEYKYKPRKKKEPKEKKQLTPADKAYERAKGLKGTSFGDQNTRTSYLEGLFYAESFIKQIPEGVNVYGDPIGSGGQIDFEKLKGLPNLSDYSPKEHLENTPVDDKSCFFRLNELNAAKLSSCAMLVRSCYQAAGVLNYFFISPYAPATAVQLLQNIGMMRNYRWVSEDQENYNMDGSKRAIMNDLYELKKQENGSYQAIPRSDETEIPGLDPLLYGLTINQKVTVKRFREKLEYYVGKNSIYNRNYENYKTLGQSKIPDPYGQVTVEFASHWSVAVKDQKQKTLGPTKQLEFLTPYFKERKDRAYLYNVDIGLMLLNPEDPNFGFPELVAGDAMLTMKVNEAIFPDPTKPTRDWEKNGEHVLLIGKKRDPGFKTTSDGKSVPKLDPPIIGIEGGSLDDGNLKPSERDLVYKWTSDGTTPEDQKVTATVETLLSAATQNPPKGDAAKIDVLKTGINEAEKNNILSIFKNGTGTSAAITVEKGKLTLKGSLDVPSPSAINEATHDLAILKNVGQTKIEDNQSGPGFFIGSQVLARTDPSKNAASINEGQKIGVHPNGIRIVGILKTNNYCNRIENSGPLASLAAKYMDETIVNDVLETYLKLDAVVDRHGFLGFPGKFKIPPKPKKAKIDAGNSTSEFPAGELAIVQHQPPSTNPAAK